MGSASSFDSLPADPSTDLREHVCDGMVLHSQIPPGKWCITPTDLRHFGTLVKRAVKRGSIIPTTQDPFDPTDHKVGPNIHTVTEQFIKPLTAKVGDVSYALMLHPEGLQCDLFVTHCWCEGLYEFIDKVLHSWPSDALSAYCCMLSNPQNLDISMLISDPKQSPFAAALRLAKYMLVVPNGKISIYTRVWCIYEAFLAYSWGKHIYTAKASSDGLLLHILRMLVLSVLCGLMPVFVEFKLVPISVDVWSAIDPLYHLIIDGVLVCILSTAPPFPGKSALIHILAALAGLGVGRTCVAPIEFRHGFFDAHFLPTAVWVIMPLSIVAILLALEVDRTWDEDGELQAKELSLGFTGHIRDAQSSNPNDRDTILGEIYESGIEDDVDHAVSVLISAGMSTPCLREAAKITEVDGASHWSLGQVMLTTVIWIVHPSLHAYYDISCGGYFRFVPYLKAIQGITWTVLFIRAATDHKGTVAAAGQKLGVFPYLLIWQVWVGIRMASGDNIRVHCVPDACGASVLGPIVLIISAFSIRTIARIRWIGPRLVPFLLKGKIAAKSARVPSYFPLSL